MAFGAGSLALGGNVSDPIPLWPKGPPDEKGNIGQERDTTKPNGQLVAGQRVIRLSNVSQPTITLYRPPRRKDNGTAVIVCSGGGYIFLAMDLEGTEICQWLNSIGVTGVLLKYRVPKRPGDEQHVLPLQDAQRALGLVRYHAREWKIDPKRIGVLGFSAGGHLSAVASCQFTNRAYTSIDDADQLSCRPDFAVIIYPGYLADPKNNNALPPELTVTSNTPPTFLVQAEDDPVRPENAIYYFLALKKAHVPAEMHIFPTGGHGYGLRPTKDTVTGWPKLAEQWMRSNGYLTAK